MLELNNHDIKNDSEISETNAEMKAETGAENNPNFRSNTENSGETAQTTEVVSPLQTAPEPELFGQYEIKNWIFSPRLYKIAAASAVLNILALLVFAQSNVLTTRGCDSPIVSKVCQVLDTVYVGSSLFGTDTEFVSKEYDPTKLEDADTEIIYVDQTGVTPPLNYPEGYFALANPEEFEMMRQQREMMMNAENPTGFVMPPSGSIAFPGGSVNQPSFSGGNDLNSVKPVFPKANNNAVIGELPTSTSSGTSTTLNPNRGFPGVKDRLRKNPPNESPKKLPVLDDDDTAETKPDETKEPEPKQPASLPVAEEIINKKPLQDFGNDVLDKVEAKKIDLTKDFKVVMRGVITKEGKFDPKKSGYVKLGNEEGDKELANTAKSAIEAIGDSGILTYLQRLGVENVVFELAQNEKEIYAVITSDQKNVKRAESVSSGLNLAIDIGKNTVKEEDTLTLLKAATVSNKGKSFILNFNLEKPIAQELINRQLQKAQAKRQQEQKPSGTAEVKPNQNTAK